MALPSGFIRQLRRIVGKACVHTNEAELLVFESDALTFHKARPGAVVYPETTRQVSNIAQACTAAGIPFVPRGAGTGLSGGAISDGGVIVQLSRMNLVLEINIKDRYAVVQPGVVNQYLSLQARPHGLEFAPDPASQVACTIGGNLAENAGGPHTLKYGVTANHILGQTVVFPNGEIVSLGGPYPVSSGPDFSNFLVGTEGTIAITTEIIVRLTPVSPDVKTMLAIYDTVDAATHAVSAILGSGVTPAALEMMDKLCIQAVEAHVGAGYPTEAAAVLLIELDGESSLIDRDAERVAQACQSQGLMEFTMAQDEEQRQKLWKGRKHAGGALGRISRAFYTNDGVIPRTKFTDIFRTIYRIGDDYGLRVANMCHAGDGNIHPQILYDPRESQAKERAIACSQDILLACLDLGGSLSGEHGIGTEKRTLLDRMFTAQDLEHMCRIRDGFNPAGLLNPDKIFPQGATCAEVRGNGTGSQGYLDVSAPPAPGSTGVTVAGPGARPLLQPQHRADVSQMISRTRDQEVGIGGPAAPQGWDFSHLKDTVSFNPPDMVISIETGLSLESIKAKVEDEDLWLPLDNPHYRDIPLAEYLARDHSAGWLSHRYGTVRDWVIKITAFDDRGREVHAGAEVVKNVAGYQLAPLYIGAQHLLGPIVEASFRLLPLPAPVTWACWQSPSPAPLLAIWQQSRVLSHPSGTGEPWDALRLCQDSDAWRLEGITRLGADMTAEWVRGIEGSFDTTIAELQRPCREPQLEHIRPNLQVQVLPSRISELVTWLAAHDITLICYPSAGIVNLELTDEALHSNETTDLFQLVQQLGGQINPQSMSCAERLASKKTAGIQKNSMMRRVKQILDPDNIFGPIPEFLW